MPTSAMGITTNPAVLVSPSPCGDHFSCVMVSQVVLRPELAQLDGGSTPAGAVVARLVTTGTGKSGVCEMGGREATWTEYLEWRLEHGKGLDMPLAMERWGSHSR